MEETSIQNFKSETVQLLKEQTNKLRSQSKELQIKQQQIRFLKETIVALEEEQQQQMSENNEIKQRLRQMANEISQYNTTVVQRIYKQNTELAEQLQSLQLKLGLCKESEEERMHREKGLQEKLRQIKGEHEADKMQIQQLKEVVTRQKQKIGELEKDNRQLSQAKNQLTKRNQDNSTQVSYFSQQIDVLTRKYQEAVKASERKLKNTVERMVSREQFEAVLEESRMSREQSEKLRKELEKALRNGERLRLQLNILKEKLMTGEIHFESERALLVTDVVNLHASIKAKKKIVEFESEESERFEELYRVFKELLEREVDSVAGIEKHRDTIHVLETKLTDADARLSLRDTQLKLLHGRMLEEKESMEVQYENRIVQLSLRLKKEELALHSLKSKESQLQSLTAQYTALLHDNMQQQQSAIHTRSQLQKENQQLLGQLQETLRLCEESVMARDLVNRCKHVFHGLATVVWFLQLRLARSRERCHHVLAPFLSYYFSIHQTIYNVCGRANKGIGHLGNYGKVTHEQYSRIYSRDKANTCITRLKAYVWAIVAVVRMSRTKSVQGSTALEYYCNYALANRDKIDNLNEYLDRLSETALQDNRDVWSLLRMGKELYRWKNVQGFCRVNLPVEADISLLGSYWQRLQTDQRDGRREKEHVGIKYGQQNPDTNMWDNQFCSKEKYDLYSAGFLVAEESTDR